ncbi:MAG: heme-binding domain-containing protein [Deltaproteobacteria bacterium]|nr:heme-binding domain-containing protein [Deltaproteobacteria bacterium]
MKISGWKKWALAALGLFVLGTGVATLVAAPKHNPDLRNQNPIVSEAGDKILRKACFDCHSSETHWPWYSNVPPVSLLVALHVKEGREHLNFSKWDTRPQEKKAKRLQKALHEIREGEMPEGTYLIMHPEARLTKEEVDTLTQEVARVYGEEYTKPPKKKDHDHKEGEEHEKGEKHEEEEHDEE